MTRLCGGCEAGRDGSSAEVLNDVYPSEWELKKAEGGAGVFVEMAAITESGAGGDIGVLIVMGLVAEVVVVVVLVVGVS